MKNRKVLNKHWWGTKEEQNEKIWSATLCGKNGMWTSIGYIIHIAAVATRSQWLL